MPGRSRIWNLDISVPSRLGAHSAALEQTLEELRQRGWSSRDIFAVQMALEECLTNAIRHGNGQDESKQVTYRCEVSDQSLQAEVCDEGPGFNVNCVPDPTDPDRLECPGGRGLLLMRAYMNEVSFNAAGNCVTLKKSRATAQNDG